MSDSPGDATRYARFLAWAGIFALALSFAIYGWFGGHGWWLSALAVAGLAWAVFGLLWGLCAVGAQHDDCCPFCGASPAGEYKCDRCETVWLDQL